MYVHNLSLRGIIWSRHLDVDVQRIQHFKQTKKKQSYEVIVVEYLNNDERWFVDDGVRMSVDSDRVKDESLVPGRT